MATLNVGIKISGGGSINISSTATSGTLVTTGSDEYAEVDLYYFAAAGTGNTDLRINGVLIVPTAGGPFTNVYFPGVVKLILGPNSSLTYNRSGGTTQPTVARGSYVLKKNTI